MNTQNVLPINEEKLMNFELARKLAIRSIDRYLDGQIVIGDRDGFYHGVTGLNRARHAKIYLVHLERPSANKNAGILAILLAIFGLPPTGFFRIPWGQSSRLAGLIGDAWISGERRYGTGADIETPITSHVFASHALDQVVAQHESDTYAANYRGQMSFAYFDRTKGTRSLLQMILNSPEFLTKKDLILKSFHRLKTHLELSATEFNFNESMLPLSAESQKAFVEGATVGALFGVGGEQTEEEEKLLPTTRKLPLEIITEGVGGFLSRGDAVQLIRVRKEAWQQAKKLEEMTIENENKTGQYSKK